MHEETKIHAWGNKKMVKQQYNFLNQEITKYQDLGFSTIPIVPEGKKPLPEIGSWKRFQSTTATSEEIEKWLELEQKFNIALIMGAISGNVIALDFDYPEVYVQWSADYPEYAKNAPTSQTGRIGGGYHVLFRITGTLPSGGNYEYKGKPLGQVKSEGGYIVAPPSIHENGQQYKWINPLTADIPEIDSLDSIGIKRITNASSTKATVCMNTPSTNQDTSARAKELIDSSIAYSGESCH